MRECVVRDLGRMSYSDALAVQQQIAAERKQGLGVDHLLFVEHPHVVTIGRNGHEENVLAPEETLRRAGIELYETDRGGDVTYHGPGQIVGYPIMDLREWKRDVGAFVRGIEEVLIDTLADFGIEARRIAEVYRRVGRRREDCSHRDSPEPLDFHARLGVECFDRPSLLSVHRALRTGETRHVHDGTGCAGGPRRCESRPGAAFRKDFRF